MSDEFGPNFVTIIDEETGEEIELEFVDALEYRGVIYRAFFPVVKEDEEEDDEYGLIILKEDSENGEAYLVSIVDDEEESAVYDLFMQQIMDDLEEE